MAGREHRARDDATLTHIAPWTAAGFALTTAWMPLFSMGLYWLNLIVIFGALACLLRAAFILTDDRQRLPQQWLWAWTPISLHAGWLSLAAFVNIAQVVVAYRLLSTTDMLRWSLILFAVLAIVLLWANHRMRGNADYAGAATWGLIGVYVMQSSWGVRGAVAASWCALVLDRRAGRADGVVALQASRWLGDRRARSRVVRKGAARLPACRHRAIWSSCAPRGCIAPRADSTSIRGARCRAQ